MHALYSCMRSLKINYTSVVVNIHSNNFCSLVPWSLFSFVRERKESQKIREGPGDEATTSVSSAVVWEDGRVCYHEGVDMSGVIILQVTVWTLMLCLQTTAV